jgi:hypothetical protein
VDAILAMKKYLIALLFVIWGVCAFAQENPPESGSASSRAAYFSEEAWKHKRLYLGLRPAGTMHFYDTRGTLYEDVGAATTVSFDAAMQAALQLYEFFAVQTELIVTEDLATVSVKDQAAAGGGYVYNTDYTFRSRSLLVPLLAKATWRPGTFSLAGFAGLYVSLPLGQMERYSSFAAASRFADPGTRLGFTVGGSAGLGSRDGIVFLDVRYMRDFTAARFEGDVYGRSMVSIGMGFELGLIDF